MIELKRLIITHLLLNLYLLVLIQPALPVLEYMINYDSIVNELCENRDKPVLTCNGKCYLGDQVEKQLDLDREAQLPVPPEIDLEKFVTLGVKFVHQFADPEIKTETLPDYYKEMESQLQINSILRPPQSSFI